MNNKTKVGKNVLFILTGSIACYKACSVISMLIKNGYQVRCVASPSALEFVGPATLEGLTGEPVLSHTSESGRRMSHIDLSRWADLTVLCPATANTIGHLANGLGSELPSALFLAHDFSHPYLLVPAMNNAMFRHPATQENIKKLESWGVDVMPTASGRQACGEIGEGNLPEPDEIFARIQAALNPVSNTRKLEVLITSGGTEEPIDGVRSIVNFSTGRTGAAFAEEFQRLGHDVCLLKARNAVTANAPVETHSFRSFDDLDSQLKQLLGARHFDVVIHLAAVGDYSVRSIEVDGEHKPNRGDGKLRTGHDLAIHMSANHKIIERIRDYSNNDSLCLIAFKLTNGADEDTSSFMVADLFNRSGADLVVHNDLTKISSENGVHVATIYRPGGRLAETSTKQELAAALESMLIDGIQSEHGVDSRPVVGVPGNTN